MYSVQQSNWRCICCSLRIRIRFDPDLFGRIRTFLVGSRKRVEMFLKVGPGSGYKKGPEPEHCSRHCSSESADISPDFPSRSVRSLSFPHFEKAHWGEARGNVFFSFSWRGQIASGRLERGGRNFWRLKPTLWPTWPKNFSPLSKSLPSPPPPLNW